MKANRLTRADVAYQAFIYAAVSALLVTCVFPLVYVLGLSFTGETEWLARGNSMVIPHHPTFAGYIKVFRQSRIFGNSLMISVLRTIVGTALTMACTMLMGYIVSRRKMPGSGALMAMVLITILFGGGLIPTYLVIKDTGLYDTFWAMIIPGLVDSWGVLVFRQFFLNLPGEVEESAGIDGISEIGLMMRIVFPMSLPVLAAMGLFTAVGHWNSWFDAMVYIQNDYLKPLQLILHDLSVDTNLGVNANSRDITDLASRVSTRSLRMCVTVIGTVPILCVYPFLQKYFTKGVYVGAVKG
ncbi:MAG: carbohydrate ABC transporter permease [Clostridiales bacterium]|nr:carbohydrate ABC transporter permease [Clostridiales bacterium]